MELLIGLMSGTSMDGIDVAFLETDGQTRLISKGHVYLPYDAHFIFLLKSMEWICKKRFGELDFDKDLQPEILQYFSEELHCSKQEAEEKILTIRGNIFPQKKSIDPIFFQEVVHYSTALHAQAVKLLQAKYHIQSSQVRAIGFHGQTLYHQPLKKKSIIIGDGQMLADQTQIPVINQFRLQDILSGGQGAPLAPIYHRALALCHHKIPSVVMNCGGIANATLISSEKENELMACDTGPGNVLMDRLLRTRTQGKLLMDAGGELGLRGRVHEDKLNLLWEKCIVRDGVNYFTLPAPKSLDSRDCEGIELLDSLSLEDACRTLAAFTADTIVKTVLSMGKETSPLFWILSGGGCRNAAIYAELEQRIQSLIPKAQLFKAEALGWDNAGLEAELMAYLGARHLKQLPLSFPKTTGVQTPMRGGVYYSPV